MSNKMPDSQRLLQRKSQLLPWIADPLTHFFHHLHEHEQAEYQPAKAGQFSESHEQTEKEKGIEEAVEAEEATPSELFYDLFFVANLTTVTSVHSMVDYQSLVSYILFFIILWFTWLQTTLYDIRFSMDSVYERVIKSIHFAVMIGLASASTSWDPLDPSLPRAAANLQSMVLTLMASRLALGIQYGVVIAYAKKQKNALLPLAIHCVTMIVAAGVYLGLYFAFRSGSPSKTYVALYLVLVVEVIAVMGSSSIWRILSFKRTHLAERMGLLTLIIMGEGIIVMLKAVNSVEKGALYGRGWSPSIFFIVAAAIITIYFLYMFYFDYTPRGIHFGSIRQQIWAFLHLPFHMAIVLTVEGLRQFSTYWSYIQAITAIKEGWVVASAVSNDPDTQKNLLLQEIAKFFEYLYNEGTAKTVVKNYPYIKEELTNLTATPYADWTDASQHMIAQVVIDMNKGYAEFYGIKVPKAKKEAPVMNIFDPKFNPDAEIEQLYRLVFQYFFIALGVVFLMYGILGLFVRRRKDIWDYFSVTLRLLLGMVFVCMERIQTSPSVYRNYVNSPWPIPTVCLCLFVVLCIDKSVGVLAYKRMKAKLRFRMNEAT